MLDTLIRDVRYAVRVLRRSPGFTATALATLALVIGGNTAVGSLADALLLRPLPYPHPDRLATIVTEVHGPTGQDVQDAQDGASWQTLRDEATTVDVALSAGGFGGGVNMVVDGTAATVRQARVSAGYFQVLGVAPLLGRGFSRDEDRPGGPPVVVVSDALWQRHLGADPAVIGKTMLLRGQAYTVVGVMPPAFENPGGTADVWTPARPSRTGEGEGTNYDVIARVKAGRTWAEASDELARLGRAAFKARGATGERAWALVPLQEELTADVQQPLVMLMGAVGMVLLIACVNLAALLLARGGSRGKELATRMALGSGRLAVVRQLMVESVVLAVIGGALGVVVGEVGLAGLQALGGTTFAQWKGVSLDARMLGATAGLTLATSVLFGLAPALQASRLDVNAALAEGGSRSIAGGSRHWLRRGLIAAEVALGVVLLVVTGLLIRTFVNLRSMDPGFDAANVTTATVSLEDARYNTSAQVNRLFDESLATLRATPGVVSAGVSLELPYRRLLNTGFTFPGETDYHTTNVMYVTPGFFETLRIPVRAGRGITADDRANSLPVAVVDATFVRSWAKGVSPVGRRILTGGAAPLEIVGVVGDVTVTNEGIGFPGRQAGPLETTPIVYIPAAQASDGFMRMVHTWFQPVWSLRTIGPVNTTQVLQQAIARADSLLPVQDVQPLTAVEAAATAEQRLLMTLVGVLAAAALLLAALGIHGLIASGVIERTRELGIRLALGATPGQTVRTVAASGVILAALGAAAGVALAWVAVNVFDTFSFLFHVDKHDPVTFAGVAVFLLAVATASSLLPALRILRLDPAKALRE